MFKKMIFAGALMAAGLFVIGPSEASADYCRSGGFSYGPRVSTGFYGSPYRSAYRGVPVHRSYYGSPVRSSFYAPAPIYRSGYRSGFGGPSFYGRGVPFGYGRSGISIGFGF